MDIITVAVLFGGRSGEHEVSLVSADSVMRAMDPARYRVLPVGIDKEGRWWCGPDAMRFLKRGEGAPGRCMLAPEPGRRALLIETEGDWREEGLDAVFPVVHGSTGEDGTLQGLFELAEIPYVGAGVAASAIAMDKVLQKRLHMEAGIPVVPYRAYRSRDAIKQIEAVADEIEQGLGLPVFVKPPNLGSSVGVSKAVDRASLIAGLQHAAQFDRKVLAECAVPEAREIEVAVLGNDELMASIPGEVVPGNEFYDYDAKYVDGSSTLHIPAELTEDLSERIRRMAMDAYRALECEGMARVDFLLSRSTGELFVNEINTIPGFTSISMYPKLFEAVGIPYPQLLDQLVRLAMLRRSEQAALTRSFAPKRDWYRGDE